MPKMKNETNTEIIKKCLKETDDKRLKISPFDKHSFDHSILVIKKNTHLNILL